MTDVVLYCSEDACLLLERIENIRVLLLISLAMGLEFSNSLRHLNLSKRHNNRFFHYFFFHYFSLLNIFRIRSYCMLLVSIDEQRSWQAKLSYASLNCSRTCKHLLLLIVCLSSQLHPAKIISKASQFS